MITESCAQIVCACVALTGTTVSVLTDLRNKKIYNVITWPMILTGLIVTGFMCPNQLPAKMLFMLACIGMCMGGILGAGDAKLIMGICALLSLSVAVLTTAIAGGLFLFVAFVQNRNAGERALLGVQMTLMGNIDHAKNRQKTGRPFAPWMLVGLVASMLIVWVL